MKAHCEKLYTLVGRKVTPSGPMIQEQRNPLKGKGILPIFNKHKIQPIRVAVISEEDICQVL